MTVSPKAGDIVLLVPRQRAFAHWPGTALVREVRATPDRTLYLCYNILQSGEVGPYNSYHRIEDIDSVVTPAQA